jgi:DMSO reductase anchor subunit
LENPVQAVLKSSPLLMIIFLVVAVIGIIGQFRASSLYKLESYNRWDSTGTGV